MLFRPMILTAALLLCASACEADKPGTTSIEARPLPILTVIQSGGCVRIGPNCAVHTLFDDGKVQAARNTGEQTPAVEVTATIDAGIAQSWLMAAEAEDFATLRQSLPAGQCAGCVDGIDLQYIINTSTDSVTFSSIEHEFDTSSTFFTITAKIYRSMMEAAPLELLNR